MVVEPKENWQGLFIKITTFDLEGEHALESSDPMYCNIANVDKQDWLLKHMVWAAHNRKGLQIILNACSDDPADIAKQAEYEKGREAYFAKVAAQENSTATQKKVDII